MAADFTDRSSLKRFAWLSIAAAVTTIALKTVAYLVTGSVGLLSDALESVVNLIGAVMALAMLTIAARPADEDHAHGHSKAEYFSSGVEGSLILVAALAIAAAAVERLLSPKPLDQIGLGLVVSTAASLVNLGVALVLLRKSKEAHSITLEANAHHLLTDVWTSAGVIVGVGAVAVTGWTRLDPIVALVVAANIVFTAVRIKRAPDKRVLHAHADGGVQFHALRTRQSGARRFVSVHVLVPGAWTVHDGHQLLERIEADLRAALPNMSVLTHLESLDDPTSWDDEELDRVG
jgi:cation diffusion facilitator family transporter